MADPTASEMLSKYLIAEQALLEGKEVSFGDRRLRMEDLPNIIAGRKEWERRVSEQNLRTAAAPNIGGLTVSRVKFQSYPISGRFDRNE